MEVTGKIHYVGGVETVGKNDLKKRVVVVETRDGEYINHLALDILKDKADTFNLKQGQETTFSFDVRSREYNGTWYTNATAWKWDSSETPTQPKATTKKEEVFEEDIEELPF